MNGKQIGRFVSLCFCFLVGFIMAWYIFSSINKPTLYNNQEVFIPDSKQIDSFCKSQGYDYGWLSSSACKGGEVNCHKKYGSLVENRCVRWQQ